MDHDGVSTFKLLAAITVLLSRLEDPHIKPLQNDTALASRRSTGPDSDYFGERGATDTHDHGVQLSRKANLEQQSSQH